MSPPRNPLRRLWQMLRTKPGEDETSKRVEAKLHELERENAKTREIVTQNTKRIEKVEQAVLAGGGGA